MIVQSREVLLRTQVSTRFYWILILILCISQIAAAPAPVLEPASQRMAPGSGALHMAEISSQSQISPSLPAAAKANNAEIEIQNTAVTPIEGSGQQFILEVTFGSRENQPDVSLEISLPQGIDLVSGSLTWSGSLLAGVAQSHQVTIAVHVNNRGKIRIWASAHLSAKSAFTDRETVNVVAEGTGYQFILDDAYLYNDVPYYPRAEALAAPVTSAATDMVTVKGRVSYDAVDDDGANGRQTITDQPVKSVRVELWEDMQMPLPLDNKMLAFTYTNPDGLYSFTVPNVDSMNSNGTLHAFIVLRMTDDAHVTLQHGILMGDGQPATVDYTDQVGVGSDLVTGQEYPVDLRLTGDLGQALYVFDILANTAYNYLQNEVQWGSSFMVHVEWPSPCLGFPGLASCYMAKTIYLTESSAEMPDVILHEYGHYVLDHYVFAWNIIAACPLGPHGVDYVLTQTCAWSEGWATFLEMAIQNKPDWFGYNYEDESLVGAKLATQNPPDASELAVGATLWDIYDANNGTEINDGFDTVADGLDGGNQGIWNVSTTKDPKIMHEFWDGWVDKHGGIDCGVYNDFVNHRIDYLLELKTTAAPAAGGSITSSPAPNCSGKYMQNTKVNLTAAASTGYSFVNWSDDASGTANPYAVVMDASKLVTANFGVNTPTPPPTPTFTPSPTSTITPTVGPVTLTVQINQSSDDAGPQPDSCSFSTGWNEVYFGYCNNGQGITSGFRFTGFTIPPGSTIQHAAIHFTVDGTYTNPLTVQFFGENNGNAQTFSSASQPVNRPKTSASADWNISSGETWTLGDPHDSPELKDIVQEIVNRSDWASGNALAILTSNAGTGSPAHRRVIGLDRPTWFPGAQYAAKLEITYLPGGNPTPTSTDTTTPTVGPSPTPTLTTTPTPPPSCWCPLLELFGGCTNSASPALMSQPLQAATPMSTSFFRSAVTGLQNTIVDLQVFYLVRNELLSGTQQGNHYIDLYNTHGPEISSLLRDNSELRDEAIAVLTEWQPNLNALVNDSGASAHISVSQVQDVQTFLEHLSTLASPELQQAIAAEQEFRPLEALSGLTMAQGWSALQGVYTIEWLPPFDQEGIVDAKMNRDFPVMFHLVDSSGAHVVDPQITIRLINANGQVVIGPVRLANNPKQGIVLQGNDKYHYNMPLKGLPVGQYSLEITHAFSPAGQPAMRTIHIVK